MHVDWMGLLQVFLVSLGASLAVMVLFAFGIGALSARVVARDSGATGQGKLALAVSSFVVCVVITVLGIAVILA